MDIFCDYQEHNFNQAYPGGSLNGMKPVRYSQYMSMYYLEILGITLGPIATG